VKLFIPELQTVLKLTKAWTFPVELEHRNSTLIEVMSGHKAQDFYPTVTYDWKNLSKHSRQMTNRIEHPPKVEWTGLQGRMPKGTLLTVDRIYIRAGNATFSSVTFKTKLNGKSVRFWAKLSSVNTIEAEVVE
jgi:hypothetical protein